MTMNVATLRSDIESAINRHCAENASNTPDFILAEYLLGCLDAFDAAVSRREQWYGRATGVSAGDEPTPCPSESKA